MTSKFNSSIVRQANKLVEARFKTPMTEQEQKLIAYIISESKKSVLLQSCVVSQCIDNSMFFV